MEKEEKEEKLDLYELLIENIDFDALTAVSAVDFPAIEKDFMKFAKKGKMKFTFGKSDEDKRVITGPALIPNKKIYRFDMFKGEYEVFFSKDTVAQLAQEYLKNHKQSNVTIQHEYNANNMYIFESWIVEDPTNDKSNALGFTDLEPGTWMISMKVDNDEVWEQIKNDEIRGFSIEAFITTVLTDLKLENKPEGREDFKDNDAKINYIKYLIEEWNENNTLVITDKE